MARGKVASGKTDAESMFDEFEDLDFDQTYTGGLDRAAVDEAEQDKTDAEDDGDEDPADPEADEIRVEEEDDVAERIGGYRAHSAARAFPLMRGKRFDDLVESISTHGLITPIVVCGEVLLDGRNRMRAIESLHERGQEIAIQVDHREAMGWEAEVAYIKAVNSDRRHLSDDQNAQSVAMLLSMMEREAKKRQQASRFQKGQKRNPDGRNQHSGGRKAEPDVASPSDKKERNRRKAANSTRGKVAAEANVSNSRAAGAIRLQKEAPAALLQQVIDGEVSQRDALKRLSGPTEKKPPKPFDLRAEVVKRWGRLKTGLDEADYPEVRKIVKDLIGQEEKA
jgi:hypothetical protein